MVTPGKPAEPETIEGQATDLSDTGRTDVALRDDASTHATFVAVNRQDEDLIVAEIRGELLGTMAYEFQVGGKPARGLSYEGVNAAVQTLNARGIARIKCPPAPPPAFEEVTDEEGEPAWQCTVYAEDELGGGAAWGIATQKKHAKRRDGNTVADTFAKTKALSKAQRNAKLALIPARLKADIIAALTSGQVKRVQAETPPGPALPDNDTSDEAVALDAENNRLIDQLLGLGLKAAKARELMNSARSLDAKHRLKDRLAGLVNDRRQPAEQKGETE